MHRPRSRELGRFRRGRSREAISIQWRRRGARAARPRPEPHSPPRQAPHPDPAPSALGQRGPGGEGGAKEGRVHPATHSPAVRAARGRAGPPIACGFGTGGSPPRLSAGSFLPSAPDQEPAGPRLPPLAPWPSRDPRGGASRDRRRATADDV